MTHTPAHRFEHLVHPYSAGLCVPLFAFFSAGVALGDEGIGTALRSPVALGILVGLVVGKPIGVLAGAWVTARFTRASLSPSLQWSDVFSLGVLGGVGFTVSLLIAELAYDHDKGVLVSAKTAVLTASVLSALLATVALRRRASSYEQLRAVEEADADGDGIPDVYLGDTP